MGRQKTKWSSDSIIQVIKTHCSLKNVLLSKIIHLFEKVLVPQTAVYAVETLSLCARHHISLTKVHIFTLFLFSHHVQMCFFSLRLPYILYFPILTRKCLESHLYSEFFNGLFIIVVWLKPIVQVSVFCSTVNTSWLISSLLYRKGGILLSPCLWNQEEYSPEAA